MITTILLFLAAVCAAIYFWNKNRVVPGNHYRQTRRVFASRDAKKTRSNSSDETELLDEDVADDENDPLGIKSARPARRSKPVTTTASTQADCLVIFYLVAPENTAYSGYELLQALLSAGLRFGAQHIFHRHTHKDGRGDVLFHCASAVAPGTFDLTKMGSISCRGLSLFFSANEVAEPLATLDCLLETIDQLVEDLGGKVLDEKRELLTREKMIRCRQKLRAFENTQNTADMFSTIDE